MAIVVGEAFRYCVCQTFYCKCHIWLREGGPQPISSSQAISVTIINNFWSTYRPGTPRRSHRIGTQTVSHSSCRSKFYPTWSQTACRPGTCDTCCKGSTPRASACLCMKDPGSGKRRLIKGRFQFNSLSHLRVNSDDFIALLAVIGKHILVAANAIGMIVPKHVALAGQGVVTVPAAEVIVVPVLGHCLRVFTAENQLQWDER